METGLKQRLVGALVLVALGVIFLPWLLDPDTHRNVDKSTLIPPQPAMQPVIVDEPQRPSGIEPAKPPEQQYQFDDQREAQTPQDASDQPPALTADGLPKAWVVQVASFSEQPRATALRERLIGDGYKAYIRQAETEQGAIHRVYVGPKIDRAQAVALKRELDKALNLDTLVLRYQP